MSRSTRSTRRSRSSASGFSSLELLISLGIISIAMAATSGLFLASRNFMRDQNLELETTQAARATADTMLRELRLGGACLPVTGDFISLNGKDNGQLDELTSRTGLTRSDLSCVRTATAQDAAAGATVANVESVDGFAANMRAYIRNGAGTGEFVTVGSIDTTNKNITFSSALSADYPATSGLYAIDERRFFVESDGEAPVLKMEINSDGQPQNLASGIEQLNVQYQLFRNCPSCDVVDLPADDATWALVQQVYLTITARSQQLAPNGEYYKRTLKVGIKPRNLLPGS